MPINIDELQVETSDQVSQSDNELRILELETRVNQLANSLRELSTYCQNLEDACRAAFAECPQSKPFLPIFRP